MSQKMVVITENIPKSYEWGVSYVYPITLEIDNPYD